MTNITKADIAEKFEALKGKWITHKSISGCVVGVDHYLAELFVRLTLSPSYAPWSGTVHTRTISLGLREIDYFEYPSKEDQVFYLLGLQ